MANFSTATPLVPILLMGSLFLVGCNNQEPTENKDNGKSSVVVSKDDNGAPIKVRTITGEVTLKKGFVAEIEEANEDTLKIKVKECFDKKLEGKELLIKDVNPFDGHSVGEELIFEIEDGEIVNDELSMNQLRLIRGLGEMEEVKARVIAIKDGGVLIKTIEDSDDDTFPANYKIMINYDGGDPDFDSLEDGKVYDFKIPKSAPMTKSMPPQINWEYVVIDK